MYPFLVPYLTKSKQTLECKIEIVSSYQNLLFPVLEFLTRTYNKEG